MKLLISVKNVEEAREAIEGGADIIDVKNPLEGSLGANFPWVISRVSGMSHESERLSSAAVGDVLFKPGSASLAALGAAVSGADYVKAGLMVGSKDEGVEVMKAVKNAVKSKITYFGENVKVVAAGYADWERMLCVSVEDIPEIAMSSGADAVMIDTAIKDGKSLLDIINEDELRNFVEISHEHGLEVALCGSIRKENIPVIKRLGADIVGIRGAACSNFDRGKNVNSVLVEEIKKIVVES